MECTHWLRILITIATTSSTRPNNYDKKIIWQASTPNPTTSTHRTERTVRALTTVDAITSEPTITTHHRTGNIVGEARPIERGEGTSTRNPERQESQATSDHSGDAREVLATLQRAVDIDRDHHQENEPRN